MAHKIFVSYKYADSLVYQDPDLKDNPDICGEDKVLTPRHYLNAMSSILSDEAIEKWEPDGEDLSQFTDDTIASKLRDLIYDSSITIVLISPGMKDKFFINLFICANSPLESSLRFLGAIFIGTLSHHCHTSMRPSITFAAFLSSSKTP